MKPVTINMFLALTFYILTSSRNSFLITKPNSKVLTSLNSLVFSLRLQLFGILLCLELVFQGLVIFTALHVYVFAAARQNFHCTYSGCVRMYSLQLCLSDRQKCSGGCPKTCSGGCADYVPGVVRIMFRGL